jgi:hypothetical protein
MKLVAPKITSVEVVAAQPTDAENVMIAHLNEASDRSLPNVAYVVKIRLDKKPPPTSMAWALYVDNELIPKYWEYEQGIYFTVLDPQFFVDHRGQSLRFSLDGVDFYNTGKKITKITEFSPDLEAGDKAAKRKTSKSKSPKKKAAGRRARKSVSQNLPPQVEVLKE